MKPPAPPWMPAGLLSELVSIPSPSGEEARVARHVCARLETAGIAHELVGDSVVARVGARSAGAPRLLLVSHLDTVPVGEGWSGDPYDGTWRDGRLVARGANDAKASCVAMLTAAASVAREGGLAGELIVALNACEETSSAGMQAVLARIGLPDAAVVGEPTGLRVVRAQAGLAVLVAEWSGRACHAANVARVDHVNALFVAATELAEIEPWNALPGEHPLLGATTIVPTVMHAGTRHNVVPDRAEVTFDARVTPDRDASACVDWLERHLPHATIRVRSERLRPVETPADHPLVVAALEASGTEEAIGSSTLSDMALLAGVPAVKCGPGESARSHVADEFVTETELLAGCAFYHDVARAALARLAAREEVGS